MPPRNFDLHQTITDRIISAIETGPGEWQMPWRVGSGNRRPANAASGKAYNGINILALWAEAQINRYSSHLWASYRQWTSQGCQVRKGAKASFVVFYKELHIEPDDPAADEAAGRRLIARVTPVFNADEVEGFTAVTPTLTVDPAKTLADIEMFIARTGAAIIHGGERAGYSPKLDQIQMPQPEAFVGSSTSSATQAYYATLLHELTHWTAPAHRCNRDLSGRFGSEAYAMEELVADLGAAFLCADLGIANEPRADHAQYLAHWLKVLKADKRAIFTAASKAAQATAFLSGTAISEPVFRPHPSLSRR